jgi:hypothetical protein
MIQPGREFSRQLSLPVWVSGIIFLLLFTVLSIHARFASDDFYYLYLFEKYGAWGGMIYQYMHWSGRWSAHLAGCFLLHFSENPFLLFILCVSTLLLLFGALRKSIKLLLIHFQVEATEKSIYGLSLLLLASFFHATYNIGETWFWYIIVITYLWSLTATVILFNEIFRGKNRPTSYPVVAIAGLYIGGTSESYAGIVWVVLTCITLYRWRKFKRTGDDLLKKLILAWIFLVVSFAFSALAPGTEIRYSLLPHPPFVSKLWIASKAFIKFFVRYLPGNILSLVLLSFPWLLFGSAAGNSNFNKNRTRILMLNSTLFFLLLVALMFVPTSMILSETGPDRALSIVSFITSVYFAVIFFLAGTQINFAPHRLRILSVSLTAVVVLIFGIQLHNQYFITRNFALAYEARMKILGESKKNNLSGILVLEKLPPPGMLYWEELSTDTSYFVNQHLKAGLALPFAVRIAE